MKKKYVKFKYNGFVLFNESVIHKDIANTVARTTDDIDIPVSAGFFYFDEDAKPVCYGESISLRLKSKPEDSEELKQFLGIK